MLNEMTLVCKSARVIEFVAVMVGCLYVVMPFSTLKIEKVWMSLSKYCVNEQRISRLSSIKRFLPDVEREQRLERILANRGIGSRSVVLSFIKQGRVLVEGKVRRSGSEKFPINVECVVDGVVSVGVPLLAMLNKDVGMHSTMGDPLNRSNLKDLSSNYTFLKGMHPVGRLDSDTSGLLLFSSNGKLTEYLLNPANKVEREYEAVVAGNVTHNVLRDKLEKGVVTSDGTYTANLTYSRIIESTQEKSLIFNILSSNQVYHDTIIETQDVSHVKLTVTEGKYRMVRRLLHNSGHSVYLLHRVRYGNISIAKECIDGEIISWPPKSVVPVGSVAICSESQASTLLQ